MTRLRMPAGAGLDLIAEADGWRLELRSGRTPDVASEVSQLPEVVAAASRWLVDQLADPSDSLLDNDFQLHRFARQPASVGAGERMIGAGRPGCSVVVGEQLIVKWRQRITDAGHPALRALRHLDEVGFEGVPATFGALTWRSPSERELPCAFVTDLLAGATDGWQWCVQAVESGDRPGFPAELGLLAARLHVALGTPSSLLPLPMLAVGAAQIRSWQADARQRLDELAGQIGILDAASAGPDGGRAQRTPSDVLALNRERLESVIDRLLDVSGRTPVQLVHGDLQVGRVLSWSGGLAVVGFDGGPVLDGAPERRPAARDVARLLLSLDQVARIVDRGSGFTRTAELTAWSIAARADFLLAYRTELDAVERRDVLDTRLLPSFLVEQACRDLLHAVRFRPKWAYATIDGLETILDDLPEPPPNERTPPSGSVL